MNQLLLRTAAILIHGIANFVFVSLMLNYDITGSWATFLCFIAVILLLLFLFIRHLVAYFYFLKTRTK